MRTPNPNDNPENQLAIGRRMKVRKLAGEYEIVDSRLLGKNRRYDLRAIPGTGAALVTTEAWGADMQPVPEAPEPEPLALVQEHASTFGLPEPAPEAEPAAADAIRSPEPGFTLDAGAFGGEPDPYSPGAQRSPGAGSDPSYGRPLSDTEGPGEGDGSWAEGWLERSGELQDPLKIVRRFPEPLRYVDLRSIVYNARLVGWEEKTSQELDELDKGTPIAVALTHETNGHAIWVVTVEGKDLRICHLEAFYPHATGSSADATEYAVLIALRQIPIRTGVIETSRLVR